MKIGFIVEGASEALILQSRAFKDFLIQKKINSIPNVINVKGAGNLLPYNLKKHVAKLTSSGSNQIVILTDQDHDACITSTRQRVNPDNHYLSIVAAREIESWFLADTESMQKFFGYPEFYCKYPESFLDPFKEIKHIRKELTGISSSVSKLVLAKAIVENGFTIQNAAAHPNCPSAKYFLEKLEGFKNE